MTTDKEGRTREAVRRAASATPFLIIATDSGFSAPKSMSAGLRHLVFENRASEIHEAMLIKLPKGMRASDYVAAVKSASLFPQGSSKVDFFRLHEGKTLADVRHWWKQTREAPAPVDAVGGALDSHDISRVVWLRRKFSPGRYVLHCSMPISMDAKAGSGFVTHADAGMVSEFEIKN